MYKPIIVILVACLCSVVDVFGQNISKDNGLLFNEALLLQHVKTLSSDAFEGRRTGTKGAMKTKEYIINQFHTLKVLPIKETYEQPFSFVKGKKVFDGVNILGKIKGSVFPDKYIVISAHYDHEGIKRGNIYNGADDNASGVGALFSIAEYLKNNPPKHSIILAAFDAEELELQGSKHFVHHPFVPLNKIKVNINMDMISRSDNKELFVVGSRYNKSLEHIIRNAVSVNKIKLSVGYDGTKRGENWIYSSDHAWFHRKGIPFLYFGVVDHEDYHEPTDDYENIQPAFYIEAVKVIISVLDKVDRSTF
ncbi:M28 family peptidase [Snuella sedimenti]|uniref:M28 family peptidase n=1 Tax=Snuella sedimenti TaxID=2798802 RepID=A0A8J7IFA8_9FLAO|nr:M28 family peptidase [Snuella sedimenti]MBJ6367607.1 M28 family peptidase [Snuella sedimenti]